MTGNNRNPPRTKRGDLDLTGRVYQMRSASLDKKSELNKKIEELTIKLEELRKSMLARKIEELAKKLEKLEKSFDAKNKK